MQDINYGALITIFGGSEDWQNITPPDDEGDYSDFDDCKNCNSGGTSGGGSSSGDRYWPHTSLWSPNIWM